MSKQTMKIDLTWAGIQTLDLGFAPDLGGRGSRIDGLIDRFEQVYQALRDLVAERFTEAEFGALREAMLATGTCGCWIQEWASRHVEEETDGVLDAKILALSAAEAGVLEELLARQLQEQLRKCEAPA